MVVIYVLLLDDFQQEPSLLTGALKMVNHPKMICIGDLEKSTFEETIWSFFAKARTHWSGKTGYLVKATQNKQVAEIIIRAKNSSLKIMII